MALLEVSLVLKGWKEGSSFTFLRMTWQVRRNADSVLRPGKNFRMGLSCSCSLLLQK